MLTCSSCAQYFSPPIFQCWKGHNFCNDCKSSLEICSKCNLDFIKTRNLSLEIIATNFRYPCKYRSAGCIEKFRLKDLQEHQKMCLHQEIYECAIGKYENQNCCWRGTKSDIWSHVQKTHPMKIFYVGNIECVIKNFNPHDSFMSTFLIKTQDEIFWLYNREDKNTGKFMGAVQYIGSKLNASKFRYEIEFHSKGESDFKVKFSRSTHTYEEQIDDVFDSEKCMCVSSKLVNNFTSSDKTLYFTVNVTTS